MPFPQLAVVAEGDLPTGERWAVKAGGTAGDYYTLLETLHPGGHREEGGMGGPPRYPGRHLNFYTGGDDRVILARTSPQVRWLRRELASGEVRDLPPVGSNTARGLNFFAALHPWIVQVTASRPPPPATPQRPKATSSSATKTGGTP